MTLPPAPSTHHPQRHQSPLVPLHLPCSTVGPEHTPVSILEPLLGSVLALKTPGLNGHIRFTPPWVGKNRGPTAP